MGRKKTFLIVDTETTQTEKVADIGCVVVDKEGNVLAQMGALVREFYLDSDAHPLFLPFDSGKCSNSGIDLDIFEKRFCLWAASAEKWGKTKAYRQFVLDTVGFNKPTKLGNMSYHTNAEIMARFVLDNPMMPDEPHTALEDALHYEAPILTALVKNTPVADYMNPPGYNWRNFQVKGNFKPA